MEGIGLETTLDTARISVLCLAQIVLVKYDSIAQPDPLSQSVAQKPHPVPCVSGLDVEV